MIDLSAFFVQLIRIHDELLNDGGIDIARKQDDEIQQHGNDCGFVVGRKRIDYPKHGCDEGRNSQYRQHRNPCVKISISGAGKNFMITEKNIEAIQERLGREQQKNQ